MSKVRFFSNILRGPYLILFSFVLSGAAISAPLLNTEFSDGDGWTCYGSSCPARFGSNWESCVEDGRAVAKLGPNEGPGSFEAIRQSATWDAYDIEIGDSIRITIQWLDRSGTNNHLDCQTRVGVDPLGGTNPEIVSHWSPWTNRPCSPWQTMSVEAVRSQGGNQFTVFIESMSLTESFATGMIDWISVERIPGSGTPVPTPTSGSPGPTSTPFQGATDLTFVVWSDLHFDAYDAQNQRLNALGDMNSLPGNPYPPGIGGFVGPISFVALAGDMADNDLESQWSNNDGNFNNDFVSCLSLLNTPHFVIRGNHDIALNFGSDYTIERHGELYYSFDRQGIHFVVLDVVGHQPLFCADMISWLEEDLARLEPGTPVIPIMHYNPEEEARWEGFRTALSGYNVPVILHGHTHNIYKTTWYGYDVYSNGQTKLEGAGHEGFTVVHITNNTLTCLSYDWRQNRWYTEAEKILSKNISGLPRPNNPPAPTPTPPVSYGNLLTNGEMEHYTGTNPNQVASGWSGVNVANSNFRRSPGMNGIGYGQTMERKHDRMDNGSGYLYQRVSVIPGHRYRLTAWGRPENGGDGSPPVGHAPDTALLWYGLGLDPNGGTSFDALPSNTKLLKNTSQPGYTNLAYHQLELETTAISNTMTGFLYYSVPEWKFRPPRVIWDYVSLVDADAPTPTPTPASSANFMSVR